MKVRVSARARSPLCACPSCKTPLLIFDQLSEAYRQAARMSLDERYEVLVKIYWDMLTVRTLGIQAMQRPFDFLQSLNDLSYSEVLREQNGESQALALTPAGTRTCVYGQRRLDGRDSLAADHAGARAVEQRARVRNRPRRDPVRAAQGTRWSRSSARSVGVARGTRLLATSASVDSVLVCRRLPLARRLPPPDATSSGDTCRTTRTWAS